MASAEHILKFCVHSTDTGQTSCVPQNHKAKMEES